VSDSRNVIVDNYSQFESWQEIQQKVGILGNSERIRQMIETIDQIAPTDISVLITGESGTGKELVAKAVHIQSKRHNAPLITVNCGAIPEGILESELFGHEKGSFTGAVGPRKGYFELADTGSIFLDEIGELPPSIQVKLLRVLEEREFLRVGGTELHKVDIRFIAATNKDLEQEVKKGNFREDLYYRLNAIHIEVPSLRERREDIRILAPKFAADFSRENLIEFEGFTDGALFQMEEYKWPGNIRELKNLVEKLIILERGKEINEQILEKYIKYREPLDKRLPVPLHKSKDEVENEFLIRVLLEIKSEIAQLRELILSGTPSRYRLGAWREELPDEYINTQESYNNAEREKSVADMEKEMIESTLTKTGGNKRKAAKILGLSERTLYRKINQYGLRT